MVVLLFGKIRSYELMFMSQNKKIACFCPGEANKETKKYELNRIQNFIIKVK